MILDKATELSIKSGYDGVEIQGANNYLIQQFYSLYTKKRWMGWFLWLKNEFPT